jgi:hypothetical protein
MSLTAAQPVLDRAYSRDRIAELAAEPGAYADRLAEGLEPIETVEGLAARDAMFAEALARIDAAAARAMRVLQDFALATDTSIGAPTRNVFATTIANYAGRLELLAERVRDVAERGGAREPAAVADAVLGAAREALALRDGLRAGVLALIARCAKEMIAEADRRARSRDLDDKVRTRWSAARRDLEAIAAQPTAGGFDARLAALPEQLDEPDPVREPTLAELIELD